MEFDSFLSQEIAIAPKHPLFRNLNLPIPDTSSASVDQIREIQRRDQIPGVVKRIIRLDADTDWEYWWCVPGRLILPEDAELLKSDLARVESILEKLVWLFGAYCFEKDSDREVEHRSVHDWQDVLKFARQQGFDSYLLDIDYLPTTIKQSDRNSTPTQAETNSGYIAVEPAHWHVEFFQLAPTNGGFELKEPKTVCSCQIWTGKPFIKHLHTGETTTRYDLWISSPLDITQPSWLK